MLPNIPANIATIPAPKAGTSENRAMTTTSKARKNHQNATVAPIGDSCFICQTPPFRTILPRLVVPLTYGRWLVLFLSWE